MKKTVLFIFVLICANFIQAQEMLKTKMEMRIDSIGDAIIKVSTTMNAQQWQMWSQTYGNNPALLKRSMEKELPGYFLDNYNLEKNDMDRSFTFTFKAYGACNVNKKGIWIVNTDQKKPDLTKITDYKYMMVSNDMENGLQETVVIEFPESARNIEEAKDAFDKTQFEFEMKGGEAGINWMLWIGILLAAAGGGWAVFISISDRQPENSRPF